MAMQLRRRRIVASIISIASMAVFLLIVGVSSTKPMAISTDTVVVDGDGSALATLDLLTVKGRAPKTDYSREQFGNGWALTTGCDTRNIILNRDMADTVVDDECNVTRGVLNDPYTGKVIQFTRGAGTSDDVQIDHVVALSDAWQKGAQQLTPEQRTALANDPLELLAVDGPTNQAKSDGDAATWLPPFKPFRCQYVARQIAVKQKYSLWVTDAEMMAMRDVLGTCPRQSLPQK